MRSSSTTNRFAARFERAHIGGPRRAGIYCSTRGNLRVIGSSQLLIGPQPTTRGSPTRKPPGKLLASTLGDRDGELVRDTIDMRGNGGAAVAPSNQSAEALRD